MNVADQVSSNCTNEQMISAIKNTNRHMDHSAHLAKQTFSGEKIWQPVRSSNLDESQSHGLSGSGKKKKKNIFKKFKNVKGFCLMANLVIYVYLTGSFIQAQHQRTNGPVNAHLRSASYTSKHI